MISPDLPTALETQFGLRGELKALYSYLDESFLLTVDSSSTSAYARQRLVVKVMHSGANPLFVHKQIAILDHLRRAGDAHALPPTAATVPTLAGSGHGALLDDSGNERIIWVVEFLDGVLAADQQPYTRSGIRALGKSLAQLHACLTGVDHAGLELDFSWRLTNVDWLTQQTADLIAAYPSHGQWLASAIADFDRTGEASAFHHALTALPAQAIHGDINEHNVLFSAQSLYDPHHQHVAGLIDFGDAHRAPRICDLAIAATYFMMNQDDPWWVLTELITGYHSITPLSRAEGELIMPLVRLRLAQSLAHSMRSRKTGDDYVTISQQPALRLIDQLRGLPNPFAQWWVLAAIDIHPLKQKQDALTHTLSDTTLSPMVDKDLAQAPVLDLSPASGEPVDVFAGDMPDPITSSDDVALGRYGEPRLVYQSPAFKSGAHPAEDARTIHAGVDIFLVAGSPVFAPLSGTVHAIENRTARQDYGPTIVLRHELAGDAFYTLYGHLDPECLGHLDVGDTIDRGARIARVGAPPDNGDWPPHLHFQWVLEDLDWGTDINGVCRARDWWLWQQLFPNPAPFLGCHPERIAHAVTDDTLLLRRRDARVGSSLSVAYERPVQVVRGWMQYLYDQYGRCYLDAYNNVPHVGHCHPHVVRAVERQLKTLSTNTRYLHETMLDYAEALTERLAAPLDTVFLVNSASEANELALRLARTATGARDLIVMADAYHGHTTSLIDISPYKAEGQGGEGCPDWVHIVSAVDVYRGRYRRDNPDAAERYADEVRQTITTLPAPLCAYIAESLPSVGGQLVYPKGYLTRVYDAVRDAGGVCIADEVQTGFGRTGEYFWGFEQQDVVPDIVVLGKPIGNGFPLAAVITTSSIAQTFDNGMEFFSTFGGNTVACAAGLAVLEVMEQDNLQAHIKDSGDYLKNTLEETLSTHPLVGDVRGMGLFLGVELVTDKVALTPATAQAGYIKNRLRELGVLIGTDGPHDNVLKIRPPSPFTRQDADFLVSKLSHVLNDTVMRTS
ncbi:MAG: aminotransferase class III-fold pyridoxal phosphate-dependent enzyme [Pseudomonadota bacterium]